MRALSKTEEKKFLPRKVFDGVLIALGKPASGINFVVNSDRSPLAELTPQFRQFSFRSKDDYDLLK